MDEFLDSLPDDPYEATTLFVQKAQEVRTDYRKYVELFVAFHYFAKANQLPYIFPEITTSQKANDQNIQVFFGTVRTDLRTRSEKAWHQGLELKFRRRFDEGFFYEFTDGDITDIQKIINDLREKISAYKGFADNHRERLLKKLEGLQKELHKKMPSLDKFWGFMGEAGVALGKFGEDVKPLTDRIQEMLQIAWRSQARSEELPSSSVLPFVEKALIGKAE